MISILAGDCGTPQADYVNGDICRIVVKCKGIEGLVFHGGSVGL